MIASRGEIFFPKLVNTLGINLIGNVINILAAIFFALLINEIANQRFKGIVQTITYMPHFVSWVVFGGIVMTLLSGDGGVIAYFILFNAMHIYNTFWVYILPCLFGGFYNVIIFNTNFKAIPESLFESAKMDGASEYRIFFKIVIPLSKPVISALGIFTAVAIWNDYTQTLYYTKSTELQTLSYYTLSITKSSESAAKLGSTVGTAASSVLTAMSSSATNYKIIELACMVLSAIPLIVMYPFAQKFFEKGVMVGSVKG